jgi:protease I
MRVRIVLGLLFLWLALIGKVEKKGGSGVMEKPLEGKKVVLVIAASNFRDEEYFTPKEILTRAGATVITVSSSLKEARGMLGGKAQPELLVKDIKVDEVAGVIFIGGIGSSEYWNDPVAHRVAQETHQKGKVVAAICIAPVTLLNAGLLKGKKVTGFSSIKNQLVQGGANYTGKPVEVDGRIITGYGPEAAEAFGEALKKALSK